MIDPNPGSDLSKLEDKLKPYKDEESLFRGLTAALKVYGLCIRPGAVFRVTFQFYPEMGILEEDAPEWSLKARLESFDDLHSEETPQVDEAKKLEDLDPQLIWEHEWKGRGKTMAEAGEDLRKTFCWLLYGVISEREREMATAKQALSALKMGLTLGSLWEEPLAAEASMEVLVQNEPKEAESASP